MINGYWYFDMSKSARSHNSTFLSDESDGLITPAAKQQQSGPEAGFQQILLPLFAIVFCILGLLAHRSTVLLSNRGSILQDWVLAALFFLMLVLVIHSIKTVKKLLIHPFTLVHQWVFRIRNGEMRARIPDSEAGECSVLLNDINALARYWQTLCDKFKTEAVLQTDTLARKTLYLELLYEVVIPKNEDESVEKLLGHFTHRLGDIFQAGGVVARLLKDGKCVLVDSCGLPTESHFLDDTVTIRDMRQGQFSGQGLFAVRSEVIKQYLVGEDDGNDMDWIRQIVTIPLQYRESVLGFFQLFLDNDSELDPDARELLSSFSRHLGVVIEQSRLGCESTKLFMVEERARLANELHDSLAQTLTSLRFQARVLDETLHQGDEQVTWEEMEKLEGKVEVANHELRSLIGRFRAPYETEEVTVSVRRLVEKFRQETNASVFLQNEWQEDNLPAAMRTDVIRIIQEALANVRKHADADTVRVLIRHHDASFKIIVEDDGNGYDDSKLPVVDKPGEHIGRQILMERATNLGAQLKLESEPGEGSRVSFEFTYQNTAELPESERVIVPG